MDEKTTQYVDDVFRALNYNIFALGEARITPLTIFYLVVLSVLLVYLSGKLKDLLVKRLLTKTRLDLGAQVAIGTIARYVLLLVGFLIVLQTVGINLTTLNVVAGAVGVGVGFGLQNIANNFISGLIILMERPIKVGDRVEVDKVTGRVTNIGARSTVVRTNDNFSIIIPNSKFISESVVNWSLVSNLVRFRVPVSVPYTSDVDLVTKILMDIAAENSDVLPDPKPTVSLIKLGESMLEFELAVWTKTRLHTSGGLKSEINFEIIRRFRDNGIELETPPLSIKHVNSGGEPSPGQSGGDFDEMSESSSAH